MIAFLTIIYVALVVLVFKILKVKPSPWPIAILAALGVVMLGTVVVLWTLAAPISTRAVVSRYVVQIVPYVKGQVTSIPAEPNVPLKKGDVLYQVNPAPYQYAVDQITAQLQGANSTVSQAEAGVRVAEANIKKAQADLVAKKAAFDVAATIQKDNPQAISKLRLVQSQEEYAAAQAGLELVQASEVQARASEAAARDSVVALEAQLRSAEFDLQECTVSAPTDGFVTDWQIREGTFVVPMPFAAAGTFIDTTETAIVAAFPAQMLLHVESGQDVELAFKSRPGVLFRGTVKSVIQASGKGQFTTGGKLPSAATIKSPGFLAVTIQLDEGQGADELEMGSAGAIAIYSSWGKPFHMISKVTIRMQKWLYFLPLPT